MNKNQLIVMWIGIAVFVCLAFTTRTRYSIGRRGSSSYTSHSDYGPLAARLGSTVLVTAGLIYTLRDKKSKDS